VRKADAEKAIEKMQGFPIGGSRIRMSWGRSQCELFCLSCILSLLICIPDKAAQAAAQAAPTAAMQSAHFNPQPPPPLPGALTQDQSPALLSKFTTQGYFKGGGANAALETRDIETLHLNTSYGSPFIGSDQKKPEAGPSNLNTFVPRPEIHRAQSNFSPFSPDPNDFYMSSESGRRDSVYSRLEGLPHPSKAYAPGFFPSQDLKVNMNGGSGRGSSSSTRPASGNRFGFAENSDPAPLNRASGRAEVPISRPTSGQMATSDGEGHESYVIQELNGTLASLDLDRLLKSPKVIQRSAAAD